MLTAGLVRLCHGLSSCHLRVAHRYSLVVLRLHQPEWSLKGLSSQLPTRNFAWVGSLREILKLLSRRCLPRCSDLSCLSVSHTAILALISPFVQIPRVLLKCLSFLNFRERRHLKPKWLMENPLLLK
jgi:hypothetical protein